VAICSPQTYMSRRIGGPHLPRSSPPSADHYCLLTDLARDRPVAFEGQPPTQCAHASIWSTSRQTFSCDKLGQTQPKASPPEEAPATIVHFRLRRCRTAKRKEERRAEAETDLESQMKLISCHVALHVASRRPSSSPACQLIERTQLGKSASGGNWTCQWPVLVSGAPLGSLWMPD